MFKTKGVEEIKTLILCSITSPPPLRPPALLRRQPPVDGWTQTKM